MAGAAEHGVDIRKQHGGGAHDRRIDEAVKIVRRQAGMREERIDPPAFGARLPLLVVSRHDVSSC